MIVEYQVEGTIKRMVYVADASQHFTFEANVYVHLQVVQLNVKPSKPLHCFCIDHEFWFYCLKTKQLRENSPFLT